MLWEREVKGTVCLARSLMPGWGQGGRESPGGGGSKGELRGHLSLAVLCWSWLTLAGTTGPKVTAVPKALLLLPEQRGGAQKPAGD